MQSLPPAFAALAKYRKFIVYFLTPRPGVPDKMDKYPVCPITYTPKVDAHDPKNWLPVDEAIAIANKLGEKYGVGFVFTDDDPFFFLDVDTAFINGAWSTQACELFNMLPGAGFEVSTSMRGFHIIGSGTCPSHSCLNTQYKIELYTRKRFVALTGVNACGDVTADMSAYLPALVNTYFPPSVSSSKDEKVWTSEACSEWVGPDDDHELIQRALKSRSGLATLNPNHATFHDLWHATPEILAMAYPPNDKDVFNRSLADVALASHLVFWTGANCERIERLMRNSALVRDKWERPRYLRTTILQACGKKTNVLQDKPTPVISPQLVSKLVPTRKNGNAILTPDQQIKYFAGCAYVRNSHSVLVPGGELIKPDQFKATYGGYLFVISEEGKTTDDPWRAFRNSQILQTPWVNGSCFRPDLAPGEVLEKSDGRTYVNWWWPVNVRRTKGDPSQFLGLMEKLFPVDRDRLIILSYMAACVQKQGKKFRWCPLIQGVQGNGKTLLTRCVEQAVGERYTHFPRASEITSRFNDWMYGYIFIGVDDIYLPDSRLEVLEILKPIIDRERYEIEPKNGQKLTLDVCANLILNSNHKDAIRKSRDDRRFANFYTPQQSIEDLKQWGMDGDYFPKLFNWLLTDGYAIVSEFLHTFEIPAEYDPSGLSHRAPNTSSTETAIIVGQGIVEQEILEAVDQEEIGFRGGWISSTWLDRLLERRHLNRRVPYNKRREILQGLGYETHPGLTGGRVNNVIQPDGTKPRLYVYRDHASKDMRIASEIAKTYTESQNLDQ
jgi:primase/DNA polymerase family protein/uncharacterized protein DUF5906